MIQSSIMSEHRGSAVVKIITIASIFSIFVEILCALGVDVNTLNIKNGIQISMNVREGRNSTNACGDIGCLEVPNITILIGDKAKDYISVSDNQTVNYKGTITLSCPPVNPNDTMIYWLSTRNFQTNLKSLSFDSGRFQLMNASLKRYELTLTNVSGYNQRWYICILNRKNITAITWQYLTVVGDPNNSSYLEELPVALRAGDLSPDHHQPTTTTIIISSSHAAPGIIAAGVLILVALITIITIAVVRKRRNGIIVKYWMKKITVKKPEIDYSSPGSRDLVMPIVKIEKQKLTPVVGNDATLMSEYQLPVDSTWEILRSNMSISGQVLGQGEFGKVVKAECNGIISDGVKTVVAVKMMKDGHSDADMIALVSEMEIMKLIGKHENIINLLGCCTQDGPLYVVVEYARNGCLREFLKKHKPDKNPAENLMKERLTQGDLIDFALQVAKGMEYLTSRGCIHRDLAARNVLVSGARVLKVADFGLARDVRDSDYYRKRSAGRLPIKWMAPESIIQNMYTKHSDVWSFGVLLWEIMTYGSTPYPNVPVQYLYQWLKTGNRLEKPRGCSDDIYILMKQCWTFEPEGRPTFVQLVQTLKIMSQNKEKGMVSTNLPSNTPDNQNIYQ